MLHAALAACIWPALPSTSRSAATALVLSVLLASSANAAPGPRVRAIDVQHIALDLRVDWDKRQLAGSASITLVPLRATDRVTFDAARLRIQSIALASGAPLTWDYNGSDINDALRITLDRVHPRGVPLTLRITYHTTHVNESDPNSLGGSTGKGVRFFGPTSTEPVKRRQLWSMGEPDGNRYWFPGYDAPDDFRTTDIRITVARPLTAIASGQLVSTAPNADGTRTFRFHADRPHANHFTSLVVGEYLDVPQRSGNVALHSFGYPDERDAVAASVVRLPDMVRWFSRKTGLSYPMTSYSQVFVQDVSWGSGNIGTATLTENMIDDARTHADYYYLWDGLEAEALANQWIGAFTSARDWNHAWINRAIGHYLDALYDEYKNGRANTLLWKWPFDHGTYLGDWQAGTRRPVVSTDHAQAAMLARDNYPYNRGALVLNMLRHQLGDATFWRGLRHFLSTNTGRPTSTADFARSMEWASGEALDWFFDQWMYRAGHPLFVVTHSWNREERALTLTVRQTQVRDSAATYPQVEFFQGVVDLSVDNFIHRVWLEPRAENTYTFPASESPRLVGFDVEGTWIKEVTFVKPLEELVYQVLHDRDVVARRWAMGELVRLAGDNASASDKATVQRTLRAVIASDAHWRLKYTAVLQLTGLLTPASGATVLDAETTDLMQRTSRTEAPWVRSVALALLGQTGDARHTDLYIASLRDSSHVVNFAAAIALGHTKDPRTWDVLTRYMKIPSWKGENILCALAGLKALGDPRAAAVALQALTDTTSHRWTLAVSRWDYRIAAVEVLASLGVRDEAFRVIARRLDRSMTEGDVNDIFSNVLLLATLGDSRARALFGTVRTRFADDSNAIKALDAFEAQLTSIAGTS